MSNSRRAASANSRPNCLRWSAPLAPLSWSTYSCTTTYPMRLHHARSCMSWFSEALLLLSVESRASIAPRCVEALAMRPSFGAHSLYDEIGLFFNGKNNTCCGPVLCPNQHRQMTEPCSHALSPSHTSFRGHHVCCEIAAKTRSHWENRAVQL